MNSVAAGQVHHHSALQSLDAVPPHERGVSAFFSRLTRRAIYLTLRTWHRRSRPTRIVLTGMFMISCSFTLSMIVSTLSYPS
jgi:hypothetical protein